VIAGSSRLFAAPARRARVTRYLQEEWGRIRGVQSGHRGWADNEFGLGDGRVLSRTAAHAGGVDHSVAVPSASRRVLYRYLFWSLLQGLLYKHNLVPRPCASEAEDGQG